MINLTDTKDILLGSLTADQSKIINRLYNLTDWSSKTLTTSDVEELSKACNIDINSMAAIYKYLLDNGTLVQTSEGLTWATIPDKYKHQS